MRFGGIWNVLGVDHICRLELLDVGFVGGFYKILCSHYDGVQFRLDLGWNFRILIGH
jgi:hypothetical protein